MNIDYEIQLPEELLFLINEEWRYKVLFGGRGGGKSHSIAQALLDRGTEQPLKILCTREIQKSIKTSVHALLSDWIKKLGLTEFYEVLATEIRGANGTTFEYSGLQDHTVDSIKSFEGCDICWIEEAHSVSKKSWDVLVPTIRKENSEIWLSLNPQLESDPTYQRFITNADDRMKVVQINWDGNPWFPSVLNDERLAYKKTNPDEYPNIWEGQCLPAVAGAIYFKEVAAAEKAGRITTVPYDPMLKVHTVWDLGFNDSMVIGCIQKSATEIRIIKVIEDNQRTISDYIAELNSLTFEGLRPVWGNDFIPHDGYAKDFKSGTSAEQILKKLGRSPQPVPNTSIEHGIKLARMLFPTVYIDKANCDALIESLKRYKRAINTKTDEPQAPVHDGASHCADMFRYLALCHEQMKNDYQRSGRFNLRI